MERGRWGYKRSKLSVAFSTGERVERKKEAALRDEENWWI